MYHLGYLRWTGPRKVYFIRHVTREFNGLGGLGHLHLGVSLTEVVLAVDYIHLVLFRRHTYLRLVRKLTIIVSDDDVVVKGLVDDRLDRLALLTRLFFVTVSPHDDH